MSLDEARSKAEELLLANGGDIGLLGSYQACRQVWIRGSMICGLGLLLCRDPEVAATHRRSLDTLRRYQTPWGKLDKAVSAKFELSLPVGFFVEPIIQLREVAARSSVQCEFQLKTPARVQQRACIGFELELLGKRYGSASRSAAHASRGDI